MPVTSTTNGNTIYITTGTGDIADTQGTKVMYVILTATSANGRIVLEDTTSTKVKIDLRVPTSGETKVFDFSAAPLYFPNGINVDTLTTASVTLVVRGQGIS